MMIESYFCSIIMMNQMKQDVILKN